MPTDYVNKSHQWIKKPQDERQPLTQLYSHRFLRLETIIGLTESALLHIGQRSNNNVHN